MSFFPEQSMVDRIKKLENSVRILQRQVRALSKQKQSTPPPKEEQKEDSDYCPIS
jgi:hypothetical protein